MADDNFVNPEAEWSVAATLVAQPDRIAEVVGTQLEARDFVNVESSLVYGACVERYYADLAVEPLTIGEHLRPQLAKLWRIKEQGVAGEFVQRVNSRTPGEVLEHVSIVKRLSTSRRLVSVLDATRSAIASGVPPEEAAATMSTDALALTAGGQRRSELLSWMDTGREYARYLQRQRIAQEKGIELAVYTGLNCIDTYTKGIAPTELCFIAGAPGTGKSILGWKAAEGFAKRQMKTAPEHRIATLVVSMEMGVVPSSTRLAQSITAIDGSKLREGKISDREWQLILREWKRLEHLPIYFNFASNFRLSQLRALIVEGIRRYNVGFVVLDHFRQIDPDQPIRDANDRDETKVRFLKESLCKDLHIAMLCISHTSKIGRANEGNPKPRLADLRGSGQIAANADFVGLLHRPHKNASEEEQMVLGMSELDAQIGWEKSRHTGDGTAYFKIEPATMSVRD